MHRIQQFALGDYTCEEFLDIGVQSYSILKNKADSLFLTGSMELEFYFEILQYLDKIDFQRKKKKARLEFVQSQQAQLQNEKGLIHV